MQTQTMDQLKKAMAQKIKVTKTGVEISAKADTPDEAVRLVRKAYSLYRQRGAMITEEKDRSEYPALVLGEPQDCVACQGDGGPCRWCKGSGKFNSNYILKHGNGTATGYDPGLQELSEDYGVKVDLIQNTKGIGWEVTAKAASMEQVIALIDYTEARLRAAFAPSGEVATS